MSKSTSSSVGLPTLLTVLFVGLKLTGHIDWSWWLVLAPTWIPGAVILGLLGLVVVAKTTGGKK